MQYIVTGVMSGTSLDGLDIACCSFREAAGRWSYSVVCNKTLEYDSEWKRKLSMAHTLSGEALASLNFEYGHFIGKSVRHFLDLSGITDNMLIASHGHTVFHMPDRGYTMQIGHGAAIAASGKCNTVCDFRSMDVALGGQGAPLVPAGDLLLFSEYDLCLNLGGFANISIKENIGRTAFDICPFNFVINHLVRKQQIPSKGADEKSLLDYDPDGMIGRKGNADKNLLERLNNIDFYKRKGPKSLGREWATDAILPLVENSGSSLEAVLNTYYQHAAMQIAKTISQKGRTRKMLVTGGGAKNAYFMECLQEHLPESVSIVIPDSEIIDMKEALIFAFLGLMCKLGRSNSLASVTGAVRDSIGGSMHYA